MSAQVGDIAAHEVLKDPVSMKAWIMEVRSRVRDIREAVELLLRDSDVSAQISLLFQVGRKADDLKELVRKIQIESAAGNVSKVEFERLERQFLIVRDWASDAIMPLFDMFFQQYHLKLANTPKLMDQVFGVRHEVFCSELGFFQPSQADLRKESDEYDPVSWHVLLTRADDPDHGIGCIRVVPLSPIPDPKLPNYQLPISKYSNGSKFWSYDPADMDRDQLCELSRLSILPKYRAIQSEDPIKRLVAICLPLAAYIVGIHNGKEWAYHSCTPPVIKHLSRTLGTPITPIGESFEYHGTRLPTTMHASTVQYFDLIPYTFSRAIKRALFGDRNNYQPLSKL